MKTSFLIVIAGLLVTATFMISPACRNAVAPTDTTTVIPPEDTLVQLPDSAALFSLTGDFNGDGKQDRVYESYLSRYTGKEISKNIQGTDWEEELRNLRKVRPVSRIYTDIPGIDTFMVTNNYQQKGLFVFRNLGDLNDDHRDEIGYTIDWADQSNINEYHIITLKGKAFEELLSFQIHELMCTNDWEGLFDNGEFIQKTGYKTIKYIFYSDSATDETVVYKFR